MPDKDKKGEPKNKSELSLLKYSTNDINNNLYTGFDQRYVDNYLSANFTRTAITYKLTNDKGDKLILNTGSLTNWNPDKVFTDATRNRLASFVSGVKNFPLAEDKSLTLKTQGLLVTGDDLGKPVTFLHPEASYNFKKNSLGIGGIANKGVDDNQLYIHGGRNDLRVNIGIYSFEMDKLASTAAFRVMSSYDIKWGEKDKSKLQLFTSAETEKANGQEGDLRFGSSYSTKIKDISLTGNLIYNNNSAHGLENLNFAADIPFKLGKQDKNMLNGVITAFAGLSGEHNSMPDAKINPAYGVGVKLNILERK